MYSISTELSCILGTNCHASIANFFFPACIGTATYNSVSDSVRLLISFYIAEWFFSELNLQYLYIHATFIYSD